ncbi:MAG: TolC family protein [Gemmatimonadaceae bacterium]
MAVDTITETIRRTIIAASPDLHAHARAIEAARSRRGVSGRTGPAMLAGEAEGVRGGNLAQAQSLKLQLEREFVPGSLRVALLRMDEAEVRQAELARVVAEQRLSATIDRSLVGLMGWTAVGTRLSAEDSLLASAEVSLRSRFSVGDARYVDVLRLRTERLRVESERARAFSDALIARRELEGLAGDDATAAIVRALTSQMMLRDPSLALLTTIPDAPDVDSILERSGQRALADVPVLRAEAERQRVAAQSRPRLGGFLGMQRFADDRSFSIGPVLGATMSLTFTAAAAGRARTYAADRELDAATARRRATVGALRAAVLTARDRFDAARARMAGYDAALLRGAREERESALASYRTGQLSLVELLDFERALARAEIDRLRSRIDAADALADLLMAGEHTESTSTLRASSSDDR